MSRKRKSPNLAIVHLGAETGCEGLRAFLSRATLDEAELAGCDEAARERLIGAVKGRNTAEITLALKARDMQDSYFR